MAEAISQAVHDRAELLAREHPQRVVCELLGVSKSTLWSMKRRGWKAVRIGPRFRPRPADFAIMSGRLKRDELLKRYRCGPLAIQRWRRELAG